jgi:AcrR family transcriptional regulator
MATEVSKPQGLRERKKRRRRQVILDAAFQLFSEQGYDATTITQIAEAADLAPSTVFAYFPTKLEIMFSMLDTVVESARATLLNRSNGVSAVDAIVSWVEEDVRAIDAPYTPAMSEIPRIVAGSSELQDERRIRIARVEDLFAKLFADDIGGDPDGIQARVMAAVALRGMKGVWKDWYRKHGENPALDMSDVCALTGDYLRRALTATSAVIDALPAAPNA